MQGSENALKKESGEFQCKTKFRLADNAFGRYGKDILAFEFEEGIRELPTMSEEDILYFRPVHWLIQFLWNYRFYHDFLRYLQSLNINPLDYIVSLIDNVDNADTPEKIKAIFHKFNEEAKTEWFDSPEALREHYGKPENFDWLEKGNYGKMNSKYAFKVLLEAKEEFENYLLKTVLNFAPICNSKKEIFKDLLRFNSASIIDFTKSWGEVPKEKNVSFDYDVLEWKNSLYQKNLEELFQTAKKNFIFYLPKEQEQSLNVLSKQYEHPNKNVTLRKMSEFMDIRDFFYKVKN